MSKRRLSAAFGTPVYITNEHVDHHPWLPHTPSQQPCPRGGRLVVAKWSYTCRCVRSKEGQVALEENSKQRQINAGQQRKGTSKEPRQNFSRARDGTMVVSLASILENGCGFPRFPLHTSSCFVLPTLSGRSWLVVPWLSGHWAQPCGQRRRRWHFPIIQLITLLLHCWLLPNMENSSNLPNDTPRLLRCVDRLFEPLGMCPPAEPNTQTLVCLVLLRRQCLSSSSIRFRHASVCACRAVSLVIDVQPGHLAVQPNSSKSSRLMCTISGIGTCSSISNFSRAGLDSLWRCPLQIRLASTRTAPAQPQRMNAATSMIPCSRRGSTTIASTHFSCKPFCSSLPLSPSGTNSRSNKRGGDR